MAEASTRRDDPMESICKALETAMSLRKNNAELHELIEETRTQAHDIGNLQSKITTNGGNCSANFEGLPLQELKEALVKVCESGSELESWLQSFEDAIGMFENYVNESTRTSSRMRDPKFALEFCQTLDDILKMARDFTEPFQKFAQYLSELQDLVRTHENKLRQSAADIKENQRIKLVKKESGKIILEVLTAAGFVTVAICTGQLQLLIPGGKELVKSVSRIWKTVKAFKKLKKLRRCILEVADQLNIIARNLESCSDKAGEIQIDNGAIEYLERLLERFRTTRADHEDEYELAEEEASDDLIWYTED